MRTIKKMNILMAFFTMLLVVGCATDEITREPSPVVSSDNQSVYFPTSNATEYELDPSQATEVIVVLSRKDSLLAADVPLKVVRNDSNVFVIPQKASFEAGKGSTEITVSFPESIVGVPYTFEISVDGEKYLNPYAPTLPVLRVMVNRVKWDLKGKGQFYDSWTLASVADIDIYYSELKNMYRFASPYSTAMLEEAEWENWIGGPTSEYIMFQIKANKQVTFTSWYLGLNYQGVAGQPIQAFFPSYLGDIRGLDTYDVEDDLSKVSPTNDKLLLLNPRIFILGLGGFGVKPCYISMPGGPDLTTLLEL